MVPIELLNNISKVRKSHDMSQEEFAKKLLVSRQTVSSLENGKYNPSLDMIFRMMDIFNCSFDDLFIMVRSSNDSN